MSGPCLASHVIRDEQIQHELTRSRDGLDRLVGSFDGGGSRHCLANLLGHEGLPLSVGTTRKLAHLIGLAGESDGDERPHHFLIRSRRSLHVTPRRRC